MCAHNEDSNLRAYPYKLEREEESVLLKDDLSFLCKSKCILFSWLSHN